MSPCAAGLAVLASLVGCSDPKFRAEADAGCLDACGEVDAGCTGACGVGADAATSDAQSAQPDADATVADLPLWQARLLGRYAARVHTFATDGFVNVRSDELALVEFVRVDEELELHYRACESTSVSMGISGTTRLSDAQATPLRKLPVRFDGLRWSTLPTSTPIGYSAEPLVPCFPGQSAPSAPEQQGWITGNCVCPTSSGPPTRADDCRVQDPDGDRLPGMSFEVDTTFDALFWGVLEKRDGFANGSLDEGGARFANVVSDGTSHLFGCSSAPCELVEPVHCNPTGNSAFFVRLDDSLPPPTGGWDCAALVAEHEALFPMTPPSFPPDC